jgi:type III secretion protein L
MDKKILKADSLLDKIPLASPKVLKREVYEASLDAKDLVAQAQERARQLLEQAERDCEAIREQAKEEGRQSGLAEWNQILAKAWERADALSKSWEESMVQLSVRVAEKIIGEQIRLHPESIVSMVSEALKGARPARRLAIQVNQEDLPHVRAHIDRLKDSSSLGSLIEIVPSANVRRGGCVIDSELGIVDARLETQLKCLEEVLVRGVASDQG